MKIENGRYVKFSFVFRDEEGEELVSSLEKDPSWYVHGNGLVIPAFEKALEGREVGDTFEIRLGPEDAFGERHEKLVATVDKDRLPEAVDVKAGVMLEASMPDGQILNVLVTSVKEDGRVTIDANHPLAGMKLVAELSVIEVREPTEKEVGEIEEFRKQAACDDGPIIMDFGTDEAEKEEN